MSNVCVLDYGMGNIKSVVRALEFCGASVNTCSASERLLAADSLVVPGVGSFSSGVHSIDKLGLSDTIRTFALSGKPVLGICLGMQLLFQGSEEEVGVRGLSLLQGYNFKIPVQNKNCLMQARKVPNNGWSKLNRQEEVKNDSVLLCGIAYTSEFYFNHSFYAEANSEKINSIKSIYQGLTITALIEADNIFGTQFHPEKSGPEGLKVLKNFLDFKR
jgi:glutamine amidotransferase